jgi:aspartate racemase
MKYSPTANATMKTLGLIGGVGPESTIDYYSSIIAAYRRAKPDGSYPQFFINSVDLDRVRTLVTTNRLAELTDYLTTEIVKLNRAGAEFGLIAANTPHLVFDDVQRSSPMPLISIVEATAAAARDRKLKRVGLFGTRFTMTARFFPETFARNGIELVVPAQSSDQDYVHDKYMNELVNGIFHDETRDGLLALVDKMAREQQVQAVVLGGTELPLILKSETQNGIPLLNTTKIHVEAAVAEMLS